MKKRYRSLIALFAGILFLALGAGQCLAANANKEPQSLHRDGTAFVKESRITQADRQAAADRAKAKGFEAPKAGKSAVPAKTTQNERGAKK